MNQIPLYPLRFKPIYQYRLWGGRRLANLLSAPLPEEGSIGEAWILSDRNDHPSLVADGPLKGSTIAQLLEQSLKQLMGKLAGRFPRFPLLLKFLDVSKTLSVQVHPSDANIDLIPPGETGKTEAWVVLEAGRESRIYAGLKPGNTAETLRGARTVADSPYWKRVNDTVLKQLPAPDSEMLEAGLEGRWFIAVGNHEVSGDPQIEGVLDAVPYLKKFGVTPENLIYTFDFKGVRFIFLWSGKYDYRSPSLWDDDRPKYEEQMKQMGRWMDDAKAKGIRKVFISFHYPVFCRAGLGPIPADTNPHKVIASYAKDLEVVVFNGHVHTTEVYDVDGVKYLMLGGGGAEQDPILPGRTKINLPADYPPDLYWKGQPPKEEYNYVLVDVEPG